MDHAKKRDKVKRCRKHKDCSISDGCVMVFGPHGVEVRPVKEHWQVRVLDSARMVKIIYDD